MTNGDRFEVSSEGREKVLVAGLGAVGSVFGCFLAGSGCQVEAIGRGPHLDAARAHGIRVEGIWGDHHARLAAVHESGSAAHGPYDAIFVSCKSFQTDALLRTIDPASLAPGGRVISLQNGLGNIERIAAVFGEDRTLGGRVIFGSEIVRAGCARVTVEAEATLVGHPARQTDEGATYWAARLVRAGIRAEATPSILAALWGKVFYNAALNPMGALLGMSYGELPADPERRRVMDRVIEEAFAVARAEGVALPWKDAAEYCRVFYERLLPPTVAHRSSMLQDMERGRPTEIDAICGEVCRRADRHGLDVWANRVLLALVTGTGSSPVRARR